MSRYKLTDMGYRSKVTFEVEADSYEEAELYIKKHISKMLRNYPSGFLIDSAILDILGAANLSDWTTPVPLTGIDFTTPFQPSSLIFSAGDIVTLTGLSGIANGSYTVTTANGTVLALTTTENKSST